MKFSKLLAVQALPFLICFFVDANASTNGYVNYYEWHGLPSIMSDIYHHAEPYNDTEYISCYSIYDGSQLNCPYTLQLKGVDTGTDPEVNFWTPLTNVQIYGGHDHNYDTHPFYWAPAGMIYPLDVQGGPYSRPDNVTVQGNTDFSETKITFTYPETAGSIWVETNIESPPGWYCIGYCYDFTSWRYHETILVGQTGFQELDPNGGTDYIVRRDPDTNHLTANTEWGLPYTLEVLRLLALTYHTLTPWHATLSINDISLIEGGVFDLNRQDGGFQSDNCDGPNFYLRAAVEEDNFIITDFANISNYNYKRPTDLYCERHGYIHINAFPYSNPSSYLQLFQE
jgi:hypothetical protein